MNKFTELTNELKGIFGENLHSLYVYGSGSNFDEINRVSNINLLILLVKNSANEIKKAASFYKKWRKFLRSVPLLVDINYVNESLDVFSIEFNDIVNEHTLLFGDDFFENIKIDKKNIRLQCERELKGKLILLERIYIENKGKEKFILNGMLGGVSAYLAIFRNILRISDIAVPLAKKEIINRAAELLEIKAEPFIKLLNHKEGVYKIKTNEVAPLYIMLFTEAMKMAEKIDKLEGKL